MATYWDAFMWMWGGGGPRRAPHQQQQPPPPALQPHIMPNVEIGNDNNIIVFLLQQIYNPPPGANQDLGPRIIAFQILVMHMILAIIIVYFCFLVFKKTIKFAWGWIRRKLFVRARIDIIETERVRVNPQDKVWYDTRRGTSPPPRYDSLNKLENDVTRAVTSSILGAQRVKNFQREVTPQRIIISGPNTNNDNNSSPKPKVTFQPSIFSKDKDVVKWMNKFETYMESQGVTDKVATLKAFLDEECTELMADTITSNMDFESAKEVMLGVFVNDHNLSADWEASFNTATQTSGETIQLYYLRLVRLAKKAFNDRTEDAIREKIMVQFIRGLHNVKVKTSLQQEGIDDMAWLLERAKNIEKSLKRFDNEPVEQTNEQVNKRDIKSNDQSSNTNSQQVDNQTRRDDNNTNTNHNLNQPREYRPCYYCGNRSHMARYCPLSRQIIQPSAPTRSPSPQQQQSLYSAGINVHNGGQTVNSGQLQPTAQFIDTTTKHLGQNFFLAANESEPWTDARRIKGKCEINGKLYNCILDTGCDISTISERVAIESEVEIIDQIYEPKIADGHKLRLSKARVKLTMGKKTCFAVVSILPTLPLDILIGLDIISTHSNLKAIYEQFRQVMDKFSVEDAQNGNRFEHVDREVESSRAESEQRDQHAGQIRIIQQQHELLQDLVELDESKPETVWWDSVPTERRHLKNISKEVGLERTKSEPDFFKP
jgi:hypothetical protein